jgi:hypothetical protein
MMNKKQVKHGLLITFVEFVRCLTPEQRAEKKFTSAIKSCSHPGHLTAANNLVDIFKERYPKETKAIARLQMELQMKRIVINHLKAII